jgi:hypothetical protein
VSRLEFTDDCVTAADAIARAAAVRNRKRLMPAVILAPIATVIPPVPFENRAPTIPPIACYLIEKHGFPINDALDIANGIVPTHEPRSIGAIKKAVCERFEITKEEIESSSRDLLICGARNVSMALCRHLTCRTYMDIGFWHNRNHAIVYDAHVLYLPLLRKARLSMSSPIPQWIEACYPFTMDRIERRRILSRQAMRNNRQDYPASGTASGRPGVR